MPYKIPQLPLGFDLETKAVLKKTASARSALAELKGAATGIPNESILINTLSLQEAKDSSAIENIITTDDELYQADWNSKQHKNLAIKEVVNYARALLVCFETVKKMGGIANKYILDTHATVVGNDAGFRKQPGTQLKNDKTGEVVYMPPQNYDEIVQYMDNLEKFINNDKLSDWDPLVKMAVIHHQFESIHPFSDGNGRVGRIINLLYLVKEGLLDIPIVYISRYINQNKGEYYRLLQLVREENAWEQWVLYMLDAVEQTSKQTIQIIEGIKGLMLQHKRRIRNEAPKIYSQGLLNNIFRHPYTKIEFVTTDLGIGRVTAGRYLDKLAAMGILEKVKLGGYNYYINTELFDLLSNVNKK